MKNEFIGKSFSLKELPQLRFNPNPNLTVGKSYTVKDVDGSNFIVTDDNGDDLSLGRSRFNMFQSTPPYEMATAEMLPGG